MSDLYYLVGLPGSGKSTFAKQLAKENGALIFSSDEIRKEIGADGGDSTKHGEVFNILHTRIIDSLSKGCDCIYDATNISYKNRVRFIKYLNSSKVDNVNKICVIVATPYEICKEFNKKRKAVVPDEVIDRMYKAWNTPYYSEGWDEIYAYYREPAYMTYNGTPLYNVKKYYHWNQNNPHHCDGLGKHNARTSETLIKNGMKDANLIHAAMIHDFGKLATETRDDKGISHYYNHANVGAYEALFFDYNTNSDNNDFDPITISFLVNHHMEPFSWKGSDWNKGKEKFKKKYGDKELTKILVLHNADIVRNQV